MDMKMKTKMMIVLIATVCTLMILPQNICFAEDAETETTSSVSTTVGSITPTNVSAPGKLTTAIGRILGFLQIASGLAAVLVIAFTGFQYIISDTPNMKEELKKKMTPLIVGLVCVFGAVSIATFILAAVE